MPDDFNDTGYMEGMGAFQNARLRAFWQDFASFIRGKSAELLSFEEIRARLRLREENYKGIQDVPLEQIVGSVGRYRDFTQEFLPRKNQMKERWSRVYAVASGMVGLPPIEVYKIDDIYFVRDGNHRVSVARQMGATHIQAHVTELPTSVDLHPGMTEDELNAAASYAAFLDETLLPVTRPHHVPLTLSERSRYPDLLGHVYLHRAIMMQTQGREVSIDEAAANWYDTVYRPAVTLIRKYNILDPKDGRTEADLYLWLVDYLSEVRQHYGEGTETRSFSDALIDFLVARQISVPQELLQEQDETVQLARIRVNEELRRLRPLMERELHDNNGNGSLEEDDTDMTAD
ncbi:MAG: hypothetical protein IT320_04190 [Anaerolineae bacterium]|nr:hypothetical protein [Anaerolineae bacterium]